MSWKLATLSLFVILAACSGAVAQQPPPGVDPNQPATGTPAASAAASASATSSTSSAGGEFNGAWRSPTGEPRGNGMTPITGAPRAPVAKVTSGTGTLPNKEGQVWREYDISPYTARITSTNRPEQALVDWILRETGYEVWHSETVSMLSADARTLRVYHVPEVQTVVSEVVDRFLNTQGESQQVGVRVVSVDGPNWRVRAQPVLRALPVQTQGISAWLIAREDASLLVNELRKRMDFREHSAPQLYVASGQSAVVSLTRPRPYTADIVMRSDVWPGFEAKTSQFDEGFSIEISPLAALDGRSVDAVVKVHIDQLERLHALNVEVPSTVAPRQRTKLDVPQVSQFRMHDRFRWPGDQVLLISLGVVPIPSAAADAAGGGGFQLPAVLSGGADRGEMLLFIDANTSGVSRPATQPAAGQPAPQPTAAANGLTPIVGGLPNVPLSPSRKRY